MNAKEYLSTIAPDVLTGLYRHLADGRYTGEADDKVAAHLTTQARVNGHVRLTITGPTLGKHRSSIGLVAHRSPRLGPAPIDPDGPASGLLLSAKGPTPVATQPELVGFQDARALSYLEDIAKTLHQLKGMLGRVLQGMEIVAERPLPAAAEERPELRVVGGAER